MKLSIILIFSFCLAINSFIIENLNTANLFEQGVQCILEKSNPDGKLNPMQKLALDYFKNYLSGSQASESPPETPKPEEKTEEKADNSEESWVGTAYKALTDLMGGDTGKDLGQTALNYLVQYLQS